MGSCFSSYQVQRASAKASNANCLQSPHSRYSTHESNDKEEENSNVNKASEERVDVRQNYQISNGLIKFSYSKLSKATNNFRPDKIIGDGGFGNVYKGEINLEERNTRNNTLLVAIKKLDLHGCQGNKEWMAEIYYLGSLQHPNLVKLIGYCSTGKEKLLVYEYMEYGSLERHLFYEGHTLNWNRRMKIILDVAKGLAFLHGADRPIIYRDFKTSNILLDKNLNAKISDFGLVKEGPQGSKSHVTTRIMGTNGYAAPEYVQTGKLTYKHDIYGFGVVLLEILTGRTAIDMTKSSNEKILVEFAKPYLVEYKKLKKILDPKIQGQYRREDIHEVAILASKCLSPTPKFRPSMNEIVQQLEALRI